MKWVGGRVCAWGQVAPWAEEGLTVSVFPGRVLVLDRGVVAEFDSPSNLIAAGGIFYGMAKDAGLA